MTTRTWPLKRVGLKVLDLAKAVRFYRALGLECVHQTADRATFAFDGEPVLELRALGPGGRPRSPRSAGLFHFALLLPDDASLGDFLHRCAERHIALTGAADHLVSQALYLDDPEGNGIEVYADRHPEDWQWQGDRIVMDSRFLDLERLMRDRHPLPVFPAGSRLGHMHLTVGDLARSREFYTEVGLQLTADWGPFSFLSWDRYHHHLGVNLARGPGLAAVAEDEAGIDFYEVAARPELPPGELVDPDGIRVVVSGPAPQPEPGAAPSAGGRSEE